MNLLKDNLKPLYLRFLAASFGSALITSIYGLVDMAMVGQYHGPEGAAAMAVVAPVWNLIYSLGLLVGIGGSVLYSVRRGSGTPKEANDCFSAAILLGLVISLILWVVLLVFQRPLLLFFGADEALLQLASRYLLSVQFAVPVFVFTQIVAAFLRNDSNPGLATRAVIAGGIFNVAGDYICIFTLDMGIMGAGLATTIGAVISLSIMLLHFRSPANTLRFHVSRQLLSYWRSIFTAGFSAFFMDVAMGILSVLFNRQIMRYLGTDALAVYGVIINISTFVQCCAYGVGQASQPILSQNYGAHCFDRIKKLVRYNIITTSVISLVWVVLAMAFPNGFIRLFMAPTPSVLAAASFMIRCYALSFVLLPLNVYATYYFQSVLQPATSFVISVLRGYLLSGLLILVLPLLWEGPALWFAMPVTEAVTALVVVWAMKKSLGRMQHDFH